MAITKGDIHEYKVDLKKEHPVQKLEKRMTRNGRFYEVRPDGSRKCATYDDSPSLTQQQFQQEANINFIVKRWKKTGVDPRDHERVPLVGDLSTVPNFQQAQNQVRVVMELFEGLPAKVRERFQNSPEKMLAFVNDPSTQEEAIALGIAKRRPEPDKTKMGASPGASPTPDAGAPDKKEPAGGTPPAGAKPTPKG